jgi:hypothetical protein
MLILLIDCLDPLMLELLQLCCGVGCTFGYVKWALDVGIVEWGVMH